MPGLGPCARGRTLKPSLSVHASQLGTFVVLFQVLSFQAESYCVGLLPQSPILDGDGHTHSELTLNLEL